MLTASVTGVAITGSGITSGTGDLNAGKPVTLTVQFDNAVTVTTTSGVPTLSLNNKGVATYTGGSGTTALTFVYSVAAGQDTSDLTVTAFNLNGATIQNGGIDASLTGAVTNPAGTLQIDTIAPTVTIGLLSAVNQPAGGTLQYSLTFTENVTGVDVSGLSLTTTGVTGASITNVVQAGDAAHYTVNVFSGSGLGTIGLNLTGTKIKDLAGNGMTDGSFGSQQTFGTGTNSRPFSVTSVDINGDGKLDLVVANENTNTVGILLGNGDGTFAAQVTYTAGAGSNPTLATVGDVNGDGRPDIIVSNFLSGIGVLLQNANGTFAAPVTYATGSKPRSATLADVNGDGKLDIVLANFGTTTVSVLKGNGNGTFQTQQTFAVGNAPRAVTVADFNGDGKLDLAVVNSTDSTLGVLLGVGDGTFGTQQTYSAGNKPLSVAAADLNGDGKADIVVTNNGKFNVSSPSDPGSVGVYLGNGNGTFATAQTFTAGAFPISTSIADLNGDGKPDLAAASTADSTVVTLAGNGDGTFQTAVSLAAGSQPYSTATGDFNGDGRIDLAVANQSSDNVGRFLNTPLVKAGPAYTINNLPPVLKGIEATALAYKANDPAFPPVAISATVAAQDPDSDNFTKATVQITGGYQNDSNGKDVLGFTNMLGITGSFDASTGTLTLTGSSYIGNYRTALRSVTFSSSGSNVSLANRTLTLIAYDDGSPNPAVSQPITRTVTISTANTPPVLAATAASPLSYTLGIAPISLAPNGTITDADSINMASIIVKITGNYQSGLDVLSAVTTGTGITQSFNAVSGTLTLSGIASVANYQSVLRSLTYSTNSHSGSTAQRTLTITVNDGLVDSNVVTQLINVSPYIYPPVVTSLETTPIAYKGNTPAVNITSTANITHPIQSNLTKLTVQITSGYQNDVNGKDVLSFTNQNGITGSFDAVSGTLTLSGTAYLGVYREALRSVTFSTTGTTISSANRVLTIIATDDQTPTAGVSAPVTRTIIFNFPPVITNLETSRLVYTANSAPVILTNTAGVTDPDSNNCTKLTVQITSGYQNDSNGKDVLSFTNTSGITGSFDASTGTLTLTGSSYIGNYREALRTVTYSSTGTNVSPRDRVITIIATDDGVPTPANSKPVTRTISSFNAPPTLGSIESSPIAYVANSTAVAISNTVTVTDPDSDNLTTLTVQITSGYQNGQDILSFSTMFGITGSFDASTGKLTLTGTSYIGNYREALRSVKFSTTGTAGARVLTMIGTDDGGAAAANSSPITRTINVS